MTVTHFAVVPVKGKEKTFVVFDADRTAGKMMHMSRELTEEEVRADLRRRGESNTEIDVILARARAAGPLPDGAA